MRIGFLRRAKINSVRAPGERRGFFVKLAGHHARRSAARRDDCNPAVRIEKIRVCIRGGIRNFRSVGRPHGIVVRAAGIHDFFHSLVGQRHNINIRSVGGAEVRIALRGKCDARAVRRPGKIVYGKRVAFGQSLWFRWVRRIGVSAGHVQQPDMSHIVVAADDLNLPVLLGAVFARLRFGVRACERDCFSAGRPLK